MVGVKNSGRPSGVGAEIVIDGDVFEEVEEFICLGMLVACDNEKTYCCCCE